MNCEKSELFSTRVQREKLEEIYQTTGFKIGTLSVRYLRVPLVTRRLNARNCEPLIKKIIGRINNWSAKLLSYAGNFQLINSVLFSLQNFWCRHFILPKGVLKRIN